MIFHNWLSGLRKLAASGAMASAGGTSAFRQRSRRVVVRGSAGAECPRGLEDLAGWASLCSGGLGRGGRRAEGGFRAARLLRILAVAGVFSWMGAGAGAANGIALRLPEEVFPDLESFLEASVEGSWQMMEESFRIEEAQGEAEIFASGQYPSVAGTLRYTGRLEERDDFSGTRSLYQPQGTVTVRQPLYHWGALRASGRLGRIRVALAENNRAEVYRMLAMQVRAAFVDLAVQAEEIRVAEWASELSEKEKEAAESAFERGEMTAEARAAVRLAVREASLRAERLGRERTVLIEELVRLSGADRADLRWVPTGVPVLEEAPAEDSEVPELVNGYLPWRDISRARVRQAEEQYLVERARDRPRLGLIAGVAQDQVAVFDRSDINRTVVFAGLEVTWSIFDGFESRGRTSAALARQRLEKGRHERRLEEWAAALPRLADQVAFAGRELAVAQERMDLGRRELSGDREDLAQGLISELDFLAARVAQGEREISAARRGAAYLLAVAEYFSEAGRDPAMEYFMRRQSR